MAEDYIAHVGVSILNGAPGPGSGRYPLGSGDNPYQRPKDIVQRVERLKNEGMSEGQIAVELGIIDYREKERRLKSEGKTEDEIKALLYIPDHEHDKPNTTRMRAYIAIEKNEERNAKVAQARELYSQGLSYRKIAEVMGFDNDSSVRALLNEQTQARKNVALATADLLREEVDKYRMVDIGEGVSNTLNVTSTRLQEAAYILEAEGYHIYNGRVPQATNPGQFTTRKVLAAPDVQYKEIYNHDQVHLIGDYISHDNGDSFDKFIYPASCDPKRVQIRYDEDRGSLKDGVVEIRRGVKDLDLGEGRNYSQVRILVGGTHYIKGMAVYSDGSDMPDGVDLIFNTNKSNKKPMMAFDEDGNPTDKGVLKPIKKDPEDPFGSLIKTPSQGGQSFYDDPNGNYISADGKKQSLSLINKRADEGDWDDWSRKVPSQFLSKQPISLINRQLNLTKEEVKAEFDEINSLENPTVKKKLLYDFAEECDTKAVYLSAAPFPGQRYQVILPLTSMKDNEIYAPNYQDGQQLALVRFPHGGTFEIPIVTVNNKNAEGKKVITPNAKDAVGINKHVADRLSGADFDGDTVMVIPLSDNVSVKSRDQLKDLEGFDPKLEYGGKPEGTFRQMKDGQQKQNEMGRISNLITDMTLQGATEEELARAVKHSMVVIDAPKHHLDYQQSEKDNDIQALKNKYQKRVDANGNIRKGAATIISRAKSPVTVNKRKGSPMINKETGEVTYKEVEEHYIGKDGKDHIRTIKVPAMSLVDDAYELTFDRGNVKEAAYADYANFMKDMASQARIIYAKNEKIQYSAEANKKYSKEVDHLKAQLNEAQKNQPLERQANAIAAQELKRKRQFYVEEGLSDEEIKDHLKKDRQKAIVAARAQVGSKRRLIDISSDEWEAIQSGAISETTLEAILRYADPDRVRELSMPRMSRTVTDAKRSRILSYRNSGYTNAEIASAVGLPVSTVQSVIADREAAS